MKYTIKSTSQEGIYFLVNGWNKHKTFWVEEKDLKSTMLFNTIGQAKASLTKLLKVMEDYKTDKFEIVEFSTNGQRQRILTKEQKNYIFELAQEIIDKEIKENGYFDDTNTNDLEDILLSLWVGLDDELDYEEDYDKIIDLTTEFLAWLFDTNCYDKGYYEYTCFIRFRR